MATFYILQMKRKQDTAYEKKAKKIMNKGQICSPEIFWPSQVRGSFSQ